MKDVSVIIVNYNTCKLLSDCIASIYRHTENVEMEIIVVDNASTDGSEEYIKNKFASVKWINSGGNLGFGKANNLGARYADGKYLFLLNSDTILKNNAIWLFYDYMEKHAKADKIGALGCMLLDSHGNPNLSYGNFPSPKSEVAYLMGKILNKKKQAITGGIDVDSITGADLFMPRDIFMHLHGFDPHFFMYYEETDLQYRMQQMGWIRRVISGPQIVHLEGGSFQKTGLAPKRFAMSQISYNYYIRKHFRGIQYACFRLSLIVIRLTLFFNKGWNFKEKLHSYMLVVFDK